MITELLQVANSKKIPSGDRRSENGRSVYLRVVLLCEKGGNSQAKNSCRWLYAIENVCVYFDRVCSFALSPSFGTEAAVAGTMQPRLQTPFVKVNISKSIRSDAREGSGSSMKK
jgi:hypothetical protein